MGIFCEQVLSALENLSESNPMHLRLTNDDFLILKKTPDEAKQYQKRINEMYKVIFYGFFHCAAKGVALYPEIKVAERYGNSFEKNYPEANETFLKFAKTYWTLKVLLLDLMEENIEWVGVRLLWHLEHEIGPVFFPFSGPNKIAPSKREKTQRDIFKVVNANIDVEEFIRGNPILIRDRKSSMWGKIKNIVFGRINE